MLSAEMSEKRENLVWEVACVLIKEFCGQMLRSKNMLHNFLNAYSEVVGRNIMIIEEGNPPVVPCNNEYVL